VAHLNFRFTTLALAAAVTACNAPAQQPANPAEPAATPAHVAGTRSNVDAPTFQQLAAQKRGIVLDVRTPGEVARGHLPDATCIDISDARFAQKLDLMAKDKPIFVYCASGHRSSAAADLLIQKGFSEVYNLDGGIGAWASAGLPIDRSAAPPPATGVNAMTPAALDAVLKSEKRVLVDFHTPWCTPCRKMAPVMDALAVAWQGKAKLLQVDVEQSEALAQREQVHGVPVFVLYVDGKERWRQSGEMAKDVLEAELARP
jgi:thioredoxin 1